MEPSVCLSLQSTKWLNAGLLSSFLLTFGYVSGCRSAPFKGGLRPNWGYGRDEEREGWSGQGAQGLHLLTGKRESHLEYIPCYIKPLNLFHRHFKFKCMTKNLGTDVWGCLVLSFPRSAPPRTDSSWPLPSWCTSPSSSLGLMLWVMSTSYNWTLARFLNQNQNQKIKDRR